jgi:predicted RNA binding protein YcfA (HicA-like mRNA interferase family)
VIRALARVGIVRARQTGSHIQLRGSYRGEARFVTVPANRQVIDARTMSSIFKQAGMNKAEMERLLE